MWTTTLTTNIAMNGSFAIATYPDYSFQFDFTSHGQLLLCRGGLVFWQFAGIVIGLEKADLKLQAFLPGQGRSQAYP